MQIANRQKDWDTDRATDKQKKKGQADREKDKCIRLETHKNIKKNKVKNIINYMWGIRYHWKKDWFWLKYSLIKVYLMIIFYFCV